MWRPHRRPPSISSGDDVLDDILDDAATRRVIVALALLLGGEAALMLGGISPDLLPAVLLLGAAALHPFAGLVYAMVVICAPLGLWFVGVQDFASETFGGREYVLRLSSAVVVFTMFAIAVIRRDWLTRRRLLAAAAAAIALTVWTLIGFADHGIPQTLVGLRLLLLPLALAAVIASLPPAQVPKLISVVAWLLVANAIAAIAEVVVGPARLDALGFDDQRALRFIDGRFRAPGLTEFNAELGMLAGTYLLGYVSLWMTSGARPRRLSWHAGAFASGICLTLSTSRSGALTLVGGVLSAVILSRSSGAAGRRRARLLALALVAVVAGGFTVLGATGASSLGDRLDAWSRLLGTDLSLFGRGIGSVGAATYSRVAAGPPAFVDNYFISVAVQFGPIVLVALLASIVLALARLTSGSAKHPAYTVHLAVVAGLACACLVIDAWEYAGAMMCLALFVVYAQRLASTPTGHGGS